jgi:enoyl-CoA hydratase/carnithine racemase
MADSDLMLSSTDEFGVCTLTMNRPEKLNAFCQEMIDLWAALLREALADPSVKVLVLRGNGRAFCVGGDADQMLERAAEDSLARKAYIWEHIHQIPLLLHRGDKPIIAAMQGAARGAGLDMALMCDLRVAAESATFAESYINMGLMAGDAGTYTLPRLVGASAALDLFWTGRTIGAEEALRMGIVNRVVQDGQLMEATYELARTIAAKPQNAVRFFRRTVYQGLAMDMTTHLDMVSSHFAILRDSDDHRAKVQEFQSRRTKSTKPHGVPCVRRGTLGP